MVLADLEADALEGVAERVEAMGVRALTMRCDVTDADHCASLADLAVGRLGRLDGGVLAAGIARHVPLLDLELSDWRAMLDVHLTGTFLPVQALARSMANGGSLVCVASTVAEGGGPTLQAHYVAAKAGVLGLVRAAARELGPLGIRLNAVSPGFTDTGLNDGLFTAEEVAGRAARAPLGRVAAPDDVAAAVVFLLGARSGFVTGENLRVDGGASLL